MFSVQSESNDSINFDKAPSIDNFVGKMSLR